MYIVAGIALSYLTQLVKGYIQPKFGKRGTQLFVLTLAFTGAAAWQIIQGSPAIVEWLQKGATIMGVAVAWYEYLIKEVE